MCLCPMEPYWHIKQPDIIPFIDLHAKVIISNHSHKGFCNNSSYEQSKDPQKIAVITVTKGPFKEHAQGHIIVKDERMG